MENGRIKMGVARKIFGGFGFRGFPLNLNILLCFVRLFESKRVHLGGLNPDNPRKYAHENNYKFF